MSGTPLSYWDYVKAAFNVRLPIPGLGGLPVNWLALGVAAVARRLRHARAYAAAARGVEVCSGPDERRRAGGAVAGSGPELPRRS